MAEVVGLTSSIIAVVDLTAKLASLSYGHIASVKRAPKKIQNLVDEIVALRKILSTLQNLVDDGRYVSTIQKLNEPDGHLHNCQQELEALIEN